VSRALPRFLLGLILAAGAAPACLAAPAAGGNPDDVSTPLLQAAQADDLAQARSLLAGGARPDQANRFGVTPLALAGQNGGTAMVELLLAAGADANQALPGGETPLMTAARTGRIGPVRALLAAGARCDTRLPQGQTALMWAAAEGHLAVVQALLAAGAEFRAALDSGFTPLLFAARAGHAAVVEALLVAGAEINAATQPVKTGGKLPRRGTTALIVAIENGHFELAAWLLDRGADPNDQRNGYTPLHVLTWVRKADRGEDEGTPEPRVTGPVTSFDLVRKLVAAGARVNERLAGGPSGGGRIARKGATPFLLAADTADTAYLRLLIELGADPTIPNVDGATPLMAAAGLGTRSAGEEAGTEEEALEAVEYLLGLGADLHAVTQAGDTAMHGAAFANFPQVVRLLAAKGMKLEVWNQKNKRGWTPLLIAEGHRFGNFKPSFETIAAIHELLIAHGLTPPPPTPMVPVKGYENPG
jgi:ankyrin repeat protein